MGASNLKLVLEIHFDCDVIEEGRDPDTRAVAVIEELQRMRIVI